MPAKTAPYTRSMTMPNQLPYAVFSGALVDRATGGWSPAQAVVGQGLVTLWVATPAGWVQHFSVPASEVVVKSAAQRITLVVRGQSYPILADPAAVDRAVRLNVTGITGNITGSPILETASTAGRLANQAAAAQAFSAGGGSQFLAASRASGARVSRLGYPAIMAIGCGTALIIAVVTLVVAAVVINM